MVRAINAPPFNIAGVNCQGRKKAGCAVAFVGGGQPFWVP